MTSLSDLFSTNLLDAEIEAGNVSMRVHPTEPLAVLNYTPQAAYGRHWNEVTRRCRGLIYDTHTRQVVARPWPKFFNYGEHATEGGYADGEYAEAPPYAEAPLDLDAPVTVTDKMDGSLGILYPTSTGHAIATRGSFTSPQALHATERLQLYLQRGFRPNPAWTYLYEIVYPENRIVLDYGVTDDLYLLDVLSTSLGLSCGQLSAAYTGWDGPYVRDVAASTLREALALPLRPNAEGVVVTYSGTHHGGLKLKIKQDDYVALHRIVTGLSERVVWERLGAGETVADVCTGLPDEFSRWVENVAEGLRAHASAVLHASTAALGEIVFALSHGGRVEYTRKDFALEAQEPEYADVRPYLFMLLDGKDPRPAIWRTLRPSGPTREEDA